MDGLCLNILKNKNLLYNIYSVHMYCVMVFYKGLEGGAWEVASHGDGTEEKGRCGKLQKHLYSMSIS